MIAGVVVQQLLASWSGLDIFWQLALMLAPWAPVVDKVYRTLKVSGLVMAMMRSRGCRNWQTAIMREYLVVGIPYLRPTLFARRLDHNPVPPLEVPRSVVPDGVENYEEVLGWIRSQVRSKEFFAVGAHGTVWERAADRIGVALRRAGRLNMWDPLVRILCRRADVVRPKGRAARCVRCVGFRCWCDGTPVEGTKMLSPFVYPPSGGTGGAVEAGAEEQMNEATEHGRRPSQPGLLVETILLDAIDGALPGGTLSKTRVELKSNNDCCRCVMAYRAAVELFVESSTCDHDGVSVAEWFPDVNLFYIALFGRLPAVWAAAMVDSNATPVL